jgi:hypothetical protein
VEFKANFSLVAGTELLNEQLKRIQPQKYIYLLSDIEDMFYSSNVLFLLGHSHRKMILKLDQIVL